ncbi:MAG: serine protease [Kiritimatiellales bacterium]|nr:serine protease [Kiritimatiellales bacterium]
MRPKTGHCLILTALTLLAVLPRPSLAAGKKKGGAGSNTTKAAPVFKYSFGDIQNKLVIIRHAEAVGSGFLAKIGDKHYILTNQHVILGADNISFKTIDGVELRPRRVELAATRDIVRLELEGQDGFQISGEANMGMPIAVFGNSEGAGVATELYGEVTGVGSDRIEVSAEFVSGNSGSPVLTKDREAVGIASYVKFARKNETNADTEFEDKTRRFAYLIDGTRWESVDWRNYNEKYGMPFRQNEALIDSIFDIVNTWYQDPFSKVTVDDHPIFDLQRWSTAHNHMVNRIVRLNDKGRATPNELNNTNKMIRKDLKDSADSLSEICKSNARKMKFLSGQKELNGYLKERFEQYAYSMEYAAQLIDKHGDKLSSINYFSFK